MNILALVAAALVALAAPAAYLVHETTVAPASATDTPAVPDTSPLLRLRIVHEGRSLDAQVQLLDASDDIVQEGTVRLKEGDNVVDARVTPGLYRGSVAISSARGSLSGVGEVDLLVCENARGEIVMTTENTLGGWSITVPGGACLDGPATPGTREEKFEGSERMGVDVVAPYPTCPLQCSVGYGFFGSGGLEFPVGEGAARIHVKASWTPTSPTTDELRVALYHPDDGCGEGCWRGVAGAEGRRELSFVYDAPAADTYRVSAGLPGPVGVGFQQEVTFEVTVHYW